MKRFYSLYLILLSIAFIFFSCTEKENGPEVTEFNKSDLPGVWEGYARNYSNSISLYLTIDDDCNVTGSGVESQWDIDSKGNVTGGGTLSFVSGSYLIVASAIWSVQLSSDMDTITGTYDVLTTGLHDMTVNLVRVKIPGPTNLTVISVSESEVKLQWNDNCSFETGYKIERKKENEDVIEVGSVGPDVTTFNDSYNVQTDVSYYYRVKAYTDIGDSKYSDFVKARLDFPAPSDLAIESVTESEVKLVWKDNSSFEKGFKIERAAGTNDFSEVADVESNVTSFNDNTVVKTETYTYRIRAYTDNNTSSYSSELSISYQTGALIYTLSGHSEAVNSVSITPDGQIIATASADNTIKLWQVSDGTLIRTLTGHADDVTSVVFSPDGQLLASSSYDNSIKFWKVSDGSLERTLSGHTDNVETVEFSPDGQMLASGSWDNTIKLWQVSDGTLIRSLNGHTRQVTSVSFSPDGQILSSGSWDDSINIWQVSDGTLIRTFSDCFNMVSVVSFSPDGQKLAGGGFLEDNVKIWQVSDWTLVHTIPTEHGDVRSVQFNPQSDVIVTSGFDRQIKLWQVSDGTLINTISAHSHAVNSVCFSPDGQMLVSGSYDKTAKIWSLNQSSWRKSP